MKHVLVIISLAVISTASILNTKGYCTSATTKPGIAFPAEATISDVSSSQNKLTREECITSAQSLLNDLKPNWSGEARQLYLDAIREAIMGAPDPSTARLLDIQHGLPSLISEMPERTPTVLILNGLTAEVRWYIDACIARPIVPESERLVIADQVRQQIGSLLDRIQARVQADLPEISAGLLAVARHHAAVRCQELQSQELAPVLKSPLSPESMDEVFEAWANRTRVLRQQNVRGMSQTQRKHQIRMIYNAAIVSLFEMVMPEDVKSSVLGASRNQAAELRDDMSQAALQARMESLYATRPEVAERWGEVFALVFSMLSLQEMQQAE